MHNLSVADIINIQQISDASFLSLRYGMKWLSEQIRPVAEVQTRGLGRGAPAGASMGAAWLLGLMALSVGVSVRPADASLTLVEDGEARVPIVVFENAPPFTRQAAEQLAEYIEKTSGARPDLLEGRPDPLPDSAIWVGHQPVMDDLFPDLDFDFHHPEEILIAATDQHLVIAGRDVWDPAHLRVQFGRRTINGVQREYGTVNAVYT